MTAIKKVAVLYGGNSAERDVSLRSGEAICNGLNKGGYQAFLFDTKTKELNELKQLGVDYAFIALHGRGGEDGCIQGALEYMNIPYTGSGVLGSALSMDKIRSKQIWQSLSLPTSPFCIVSKSNFKASDVNEVLAQLGGKVMVKPSHEGSSIGMAMAENAEQLARALTEAFGFDEHILVEAWIDGPEYTVSILGDNALPAIHMETPRDFYDYEAKYQSTSTQYHCPCGLANDEEETLGQLALSAFKATGAQGWGRVDLMKTSAGKWQLLEVNTVPGMTETSLVPKSALQYGLSFEELVCAILQLAIDKTEKGAH